MPKIKIGVIGTGGISNAHLCSYKRNPDVEVYALCDIDKERVEMMAEKYGVPLERTFTDKDEMLKLTEIDAVSVCTWNSAHAECVIAALNAGKHVLCEKPMAMNFDEAKAMYEAAQRNNKLLMIGFVRRHGRDAKIVKDFVKDDFFGELYYAKATYLRRNGNPGGWFGDKSRSGGGPLIDLGVHVIDLVRYLFGNPKPVSVYGATFQKLFNRPDIIGSKAWEATGSRGTKGKCDVEDMVSALIRFDNGAVLNLEASFTMNRKKDEANIELFGTKAGTKLDPQLEIYTDMNNRLVDVSFADETSFDFDGAFQAEIDHYVDCVAGRAECIAPAEDGVELMRILDAVYESAATGHEVIL